MHRLWSDGRWNKLTVAHGCYWKKCTFCDVTLDYIARYDRPRADLLVDRIEALIAETGQTGFHFVDEAAPPAGAARARRAAASRASSRSRGGATSASRRRSRPSSGALLARSGCVAISGGLEVASDRLLELMKKGVTVEQVARVTRAFTDAGIMVHAYLMYGFPTETAQETIDALERVRQLFAEGCIQSAFWHRFAATAHSPIGQAPGAVRHPAPPAAGDRRSRTTTSRSTIRPAAITTSSARACARRSTTTCTASGSTPTCGRGSRRWRSPCAAAAARAGGVGRAARARQCRRRRCRPT